MRVTMRCKHCKEPIVIAEDTHTRYAISSMKRYLDGQVDVRCKKCGTPMTLINKMTVDLTQAEKVSTI